VDDPAVYQANQKERNRVLVAAAGVFSFAL